MKDYEALARRSIGPGNLAAAIACEAVHKTTGSSRELIALGVLCKSMHELGVLMTAKALMEAAQEERARRELERVRSLRSRVQL